MKDSITISKEDYLKAVLEAECEGQTVISSLLAHWLSVSPPAVTMALKRLKRDGYVEVKADGIVRLTHKGRETAYRTARRHHLIERMLSEMFGMDWYRVHDEAERLEHALSPELEAVIAAKLGNPARDPHGDPIPTLDGRVEEPPARSLPALRPGERGILVRVSDADPDVLRQLTRLGIALGQEVEVLAEREAAGTLAVRVAGVTHALAASVAAAMQVEVDDEA